MKRIFILALAIISTTFSVAFADKQDVINATGKVVVARPKLDDKGEHVKDEAGEQQYEWYAGTGFVFKEFGGFTYVMTAGHVVDGSTKGYVQFGQEKIPIIAVVAHKYTVETVDDVSVLALNSKDFKTAPPKPLELLTPRKHPAVGAKVFIYGYPDGKPTKKLASIRWAQEHAFITDQETPPGFSGSPVYNEELDKVFGIVQLRNSKSGTTHTIYRALNWTMPE